MSGLSCTGIALCILGKTVLHHRWHPILHHHGDLFNLQAFFDMHFWAHAQNQEMAWCPGPGGHAQG